MTDKKQIFISHATLDDAHVDKIATMLTDAGHTVWVDHHHLAIGSPSWEKAIKDAIRACDIGLFLMSKKALASKICEGECQLVQELGKQLYVLRHEPCDPIEIWFTIKQIQYADLVTHFDDGVQRLIRALDGETGADLPTATIRITGAGDMAKNLPYLKNPLRGRDADVAWIKDHLGAHVTQIIGTGGLGKSRLVAEIALNTPQGVVWHRCESNNFPDLQIALRQHTGLPEGTPIAVTVERIIAQKPLIVVDNAEAVSDTARPDYINLLTELTGRGVCALLTSRKAWQLKPRIEHPLGFLDSTSGVAVARDFILADKIALDEPQIANLASACKYYPRLMEFSIGQLHEFKYEVILKRLNSLSYDAHEDLQEALDEMITKTVAQMATEKHGADADALLRRLTWLTATFPEAVITALMPDGWDEDRMASALALMRRYQFIRYDDGAGRYRLAELVREALGTDPTAFPIYADFYTKRAEEIFDDLPPEDWHDNEDGTNADDITNIKALGEELLRHTHDGTDKDLVRALEFAGMTKNYVINRMEARVWSWLEMGLLIVQTLKKVHSNDGTLIGYEAAILSELGMVYHILGQMDKSLAYMEKSLSLIRVLGDKHGEATALTNIGSAYSALGEVQKALAYYQQALILRYVVGDKDGEAVTLNNIGSAYSVLGDAQNALAHYQQALEISRVVGNKKGEGTTLVNISGVYRMLGDKQNALIYLEEALPLLRVIGDKRGEATTLNNIGLIYYELVDKHKALIYYEQALSLYRTVGDRSGEGTTLNNIAGIYYALGDKQKMLMYLEQALLIRHAVGDRGGEAGTLYNIGSIYYSTGDLEKAVAYFESAIQTTFPQDPNLPKWRGELAWLKGQRGG